MCLHIAFVMKFYNCRACSKWNKICISLCFASFAKMFCLYCVCTIAVKSLKIRLLDSPCLTFQAFWDVTPETLAMPLYDLKSPRLRAANM